MIDNTNFGSAQLQAIRKQENREEKFYRRLFIFCVMFSALFAVGFLSLIAAATYLLIKNA